MTLVLPSGLLAQIGEEARAAFPNECCGLIEGVIGEDAVTVLALHPAANLAPDPASGFEIDPAVHLRLLRTLRGTGRAIVGCYHSHPNGKAEPSARDRATGGQEGFVWVIAAVTGVIVEIKAFTGPDFNAVSIEC